MSTTYIASIVAFLTLVLPVLGVHVANPGTLTALITEAAGVVAVLYTFIGRYRAGGINAFGIRKD